MADLQKFRSEVRARLAQAERARSADLEALCGSLTALAACLDPVLSVEREKAQEALARERWERAQDRKDVSAQHYGHGRGAAQCRVKTCRKWKSSPAAPCDYCGDDPVGNSGLDPTARDRMEYNRAYGRAY